MGGQDRERFGPETNANVVPAAAKTRSVAAVDEEHLPFPKGWPRTGWYLIFRSMHVRRGLERTSGPSTGPDSNQASKVKYPYGYSAILCLLGHNARPRLSGPSRRGPRHCDATLRRVQMMRGRSCAAYRTLPPFGSVRALTSRAAAELHRHIGPCDLPATGHGQIQGTARGQGCLALVSCPRAMGHDGRSLPRALT